MKKTMQQPSQHTLSRTAAEHALVRSLKFLRTVGTDSIILAALQEIGFAQPDLKQGWSLVFAACSTASPTDPTAPVAPVVDALKKVEAWQSTMFLRARAALHRLHPVQEAFVFDNLTAGQGVSAVVSVAVFLDRCSALEGSPERKATRKADHTAIATLETRGVTAEERKHMRHLVHFVENSPAPPVEAKSDTASAARMQALTELHAWIQDWTECARSVITRRDHLLRLGIGKRRAPTPKPPAVVATPVVTPVVTPAPPAIAQLPFAATPAQLNALNGGTH